MNPWTSAADGDHRPKSDRLGVYRLGHVNVEVILDWDQTGGAFYCVPNDEGLPRVRIGMDYKEWEQVVNVAMHEALEFTLAQMDAVHRPTGRHTGESSDRLFVFDHQQFTEATCRVAYFLCNLVPDLNAAWKRRNPDA